MREANYNTTLNNKMKPKILRAWKINDNYQGGVPDNFYLGHFNELWMECKFLKELPKRDTTVVVPDCSQLQLDWLEDLGKGGKARCVILGLKGGKGFIFKTEHEWVNGISTGYIRQHLMGYDEMANFLCSQWLNRHTTTPFDFIVAGQYGEFQK